MLNKVLQTIGTRGIMAILLLVNAVVLARLGKEVFGDISLIVIAVTAMMITFNVYGGTIVYFAPRKDKGSLLFGSYLWAILNTGFFYLLMQVFPLVPEEYMLHVLCLGFIESAFTAHLNLILGENRITLFNGISVIRTTSLLLSALCCIHVFEIKSAFASVWSTYCSFGITWALTLIYSGRHLLNIAFQDLKQNSIDLIKHGFFSQVSNLLQLVNYRADVYMLEYFFPSVGRGMVGVYGAANKIAEGVWIGAKSLGTLQYAEVSNKERLQDAQDLSFIFLKVSVLLTAGVLSIALLIPLDVYLWILHDSYVEIKSLLWALSPGILALSGSIICTHYFSGIGKHRLNPIPSALGMVCTLALGLLLIPEYGLIGAAWTTSISYSLSFVCYIVLMLREPHTSLKHFIPNKKDVELLQLMIQKRVKSNPEDR